MTREAIRYKLNELRMMLNDGDKVDDGTCKMLVPVVNSIERKVKSALFERGDNNGNNI